MDDLLGGLTDISGGAPPAYTTAGLPNLGLPHLAPAQHGGNVRDPAGSEASFAHSLRNARFDDDEMAEQELFGGDGNEADRRSAVSAYDGGPGMERLRVHISTQPGYVEALMGVGIRERPLANPSGITASWSPMEDGGDEPVALRVTNVNVPIACFAPDAENVTDWRTPADNETRQRFAAIASLLSLHFAGTAQGILSGDHAEISEARERGLEPDEIAKLKETLCPIPSYIYRPAKATDGTYIDFNLCMPQFYIGAEALYHPTGGQIVALRFWKLVRPLPWP